MAQIKLFEVTSGKVRIRSLKGSADEQKRLSDLGLHPGSRVEVLQHNGENGIVVAVNDDGRMVLDASSSEQVIVTIQQPVTAGLAISALKPGDRARIVGLGRSRPEYRQKLMSMGLTPGATFEITRMAPLGDPVEIRVRGFSLTLRKNETEMIAVEKL
ncbi:FeoA family protein [Xanthobacter sp. TB0139]|uniref:FeoA family protein n=1 Tax=Xanthobacter sp. TB0139 TaxID=3459178 RepID=UPI004039ACD6